MAVPKGSPCTIQDCEFPVVARGWCSKHYTRWRTHGDPLFEAVVSTACSKCKVNERRPNHSWCQPCNNEASRKWNASEAGPRWRRYKLKKQDIVAMKTAQDNSCMICQDSFETVEDHVDHDNRCCPQKDNDKTCGQCVRDLLCGSCNQGLGNFKDSPERLANAIKYLAKWDVR